MLDREAHWCCVLLPPPFTPALVDRYSSASPLGDPREVVVPMGSSSDDTVRTVVDKIASLPATEPVA